MSKADLEVSVLKLLVSSVLIFPVALRLNGTKLPLRLLYLRPPFSSALACHQQTIHLIAVLTPCQPLHCLWVRPHRYDSSLYCLPQVQVERDLTAVCPTQVQAVHPQSGLLLLRLRFHPL